MERANNLVAVPLMSKWSDLGNWEAVWKEMKPNHEGLSLSKNAYAINCADSLLRSENPSQQLVGVGLKNIIAVAMPDAVLIADKSQAQDVKLVVQKLKKEGVEHAEVFPKDHRPWGSFELLATANRFQVKRIIVKPGED